MSAPAESTTLPAHAESRPAGFATVLVAWVMALAILATTLLPLLGPAIRDETLVDNDDAMRLVQMREWMSGKSWFDLNAHRVDPPAGMISHWPRLIEVPMAGAIAGLSAVVGRDLAERIVVAIWPLVLLAALALATLALAARLFAPSTLLAAAVVFGLNPLFIFQLLPGRIDHHGWQMLLVVLVTHQTIRATADRRGGAAIAAGVLCGLSLAIGLETLPLIAVAAAVFGAAWIVEGHRVSFPVRNFGAALALSAPAFFVASIPYSRWFEPVCDALSPAWLMLACGGGIALVGLASVPVASNIRLRAAAAFLAAGAVALVFAGLFPHCIAAPYADLDPLVRDLWMNKVGEANPTLTLVAESPKTFLYFLAFPLVGLLGLVAAAFRKGERRAPFVILLAGSTMALALSLYAMRSVPIAALFGLFGWLYLVDRALSWTASPALRVSGLLLVTCLALPFPWSLLGSLLPAKANAAIDASCGSESDMAVLAREPKGLVLSLPRLGPRILVATDHDILAAPYHRNNAGNHFALKTLTAPHDLAHAEIKSRGVRYVALCTSDSDLPRLLDYRAGSLLRALADEKPPSWLAPLPPLGPIRAWRVVE